MAAPEVRAVGEYKAAAGNTISPGLPAGTEAGDLLLMFCETAAQEVTAEGWTLLKAVTKEGTRLTVLWKKAVGADATKTNKPEDHIQGRIIGIKKGTWNEAAPFQGETESTQAKTKSVSVTGGTSTSAECLILIGVAGDLPDESTTNTQFATWANANLESVTERIDNCASTGNGGALGGATGIKKAAGAWGATTVTATTEAVRANLSVAIAPPAAGKTVEIKAAQSLAMTLTATLAKFAELKAVQSLASTITASLGRTAILGAAQAATTSIAVSLSRTALLRTAQSLTATITAKLAGSAIAVLHAAQSMSTTIGVNLSRTAILRSAQSVASTITANLSRTVLIRAAQGLTSTIKANLSRTVVLHAAQSLTETITAQLVLAGTAVIRVAQSITTTVKASLVRTVVLKAAQSLATTISARLQVAGVIVIRTAQSLAVTTTSSLSRTTIARVAQSLLTSITAKLAFWKPASKRWEIDPEGRWDQSQPHGPSILGPSSEAERWKASSDGEWGLGSEAEFPSETLFPSGTLFPSPPHRRWPKTTSDRW